jgi:hypothetical protein
MIKEGQVVPDVKKSHQVGRDAPYLLNFKRLIEAFNG